ncbi:hypothetical protein DY000_02031738 [Brassica cretica]|uniref:Uncharacterized protein n=1 Tax=Brassica cretica TaxID=69181 RepID=A0ABQ7DN80_BRACR|nr:hypothetical protein DY000_02031738 [Brassica cretica]
MRLYSSALKRLQKTPKSPLSSKSSLNLIPPEVPFREGQEPSKQRDVGEAHSSCSRLATSTGPRDIRRLGSHRHKPCGRKEENLERQVRPRGSQAKTLAPGYGRNKFHGQGARKDPSPTSRRPGHIAQCSELPGEEDIGRQWKLRQHHLPSRLSRSRTGGKSSNTENNPTHRIQRRSQGDRWRGR